MEENVLTDNDIIILKKMADITNVINNTFGNLFGENSAEPGGAFDTLMQNLQEKHEFNNEAFKEQEKLHSFRDKNANEFEQLKEQLSPAAKIILFKLYATAMDPIIKETGITIV